LALHNFAKLAAAADAAKLAESGYMPLSLIAEDLAPGKIPVKRAGNLIKLLRARDGVLTGLMTIEDFEDAVYDVVEVATKAIHTFDLPVVQQVEAKFDQQKAEVFAECRRSLRVLLAGLLEMLEYVEHRQRDQLDDAMDAVEEAMEGVGRAQDLAIAARG
jgi:hypothetical protein